MKTNKKKERDGILTLTLIYNLHILYCLVALKVLPISV